MDTTIQIRMDAELLARVMRAVEAAGPEWDRSAWIREAIRAALARTEKPSASADTTRG